MRRDHKLSVGRYKNAVKRFVEWRKSVEFATAEHFAGLDYQLGEYINFLYQDDRPTGWVGDCIAVFNRFVLPCRLK